MDVASEQARSHPFIADADHRALAADHKLPPALSISPSTNYARPPSTASPARGIPVTEVHKWQQHSPSSSNANNNGSRPTLASPQKRCPQPAAQKIGTPAPSAPIPAQRAAINRANSAHSTGPRTEPGKQRSSLNALRHGLTARTAVLPTEDPEAYQRHIQQFLDEYAPATPTETQLVHEIANTAWRLNRIPFLEAELLSQAPNPQPSSRPRHAWPARLAPLPPVPKSSRSAPRHPRRAPPPGTPPAQRSGRTPHTPSAQRTSLGVADLGTSAHLAPLSRQASWLRFFKRTSRAPRTTPDASEPRLLRPHASPPGRPDAPSRILRTPVSRRKNLPPLEI